MLPRTLLHAFLLTTLACGDAPGDGDSGSSGDGGGSSSGGGEPTTGAEPQSVAELAACDEVDLQASGWMGPAFDPETGALRAPLEPPAHDATVAGARDSSCQRRSSGALATRYSTSVCTRRDW